MTTPRDLNIPFEPHDEQPMADLNNASVSGGLVIMAAKVEGDPGFVFRFARPDGSGFYPPMILVIKEPELDGLQQLVADAIARAREVL